MATGFIGLGIMGEGMAARLLSKRAAGTPENPLLIWNRSREKCEKFKTRFTTEEDEFSRGHCIEIMESPKAVTEASRIVYSMLSTPEASHAVFDSEDGVGAGIHNKTMLIDCATLAESDMIRMEEAVVAKNGKFLEAPVSGSKVPAAQGTLVFLCAGAQEIFDDSEAQRGLTAMGKASHFLSPAVGFGTRAKLVVNSLMATMMATFGESLTLAESVGLDASKMIDIVGQSAVNCPMFALKGPKMLEHDHSTNFPLKHAYKDIKLAVDMARENGAEFCINEKASELFNQANGDAMLADADFSAVFEVINSKSK
jgi:3-hydroxyisobutyrate dehydrogenase-like beta-hydroxyacid dehydrogenase